MDTENTPKTPGYCTGCEQHCKYGYTRTHDGKILPTINGEPHEYIIRPDGNITSAAVNSPTYAQILANIIAKTCEKYHASK